MHTIPPKSNTIRIYCGDTPVESNFVCDVPYGETLGEVCEALREKGVDLEVHKYAYAMKSSLEWKTRARMSKKIREDILFSATPGLCSEKSRPVGGLGLKNWLNEKCTRSNIVEPQVQLVACIAPKVDHI